MLSVRKNVTVADTSCIVSGRLEERLGGFCLCLYEGRYLGNNSLSTSEEFKPHEAPFEAQRATQSTALTRDRLRWVT